MAKLNIKKLLEQMKSQEPAHIASVDDKEFILPNYSGDKLLSHPHQNVNTTASPQFANLIVNSSGAIKPSSDGTSAVNIANAAGTNFVSFDTTNLRVGIGTTVPGVPLEIQGTGALLRGIRFTTTAAGGGNLQCGRSHDATVGTNTLVQSGDTLGAVLFLGANGTTYTTMSSIIGIVDGTPAGGSDMPGALTFNTVPSGSGALNERIRIAANGYVGINTISPQTNLHVSGSAYINGGLGLGVLNTTANTLKLSGSDPFITLEGHGGTSQTINIGNLTQHSLGRLLFLNSDSQINWGIMSGLISNGSLSFTPSTAGGGLTFTTPAVIILQSGKMGIGTLNPSEQLHVSGGNILTNGVYKINSSSGAAGSFTTVDSKTVTVSGGIIISIV